MSGETANAIVSALLCVLWCLCWALWLQRWDRSKDAFRIACEVEAAKDVLGMPFAGAGAAGYRTAFDRVGGIRRSAGAKLRREVTVRRGH